MIFDFEEKKGKEKKIYIVTLDEPLIHLRCPYISFFIFFLPFFSSLSVLNALAQQPALKSMK